MSSVSAQRFQALTIIEYVSRSSGQNRILFGGPTPAGRLHLAPLASEQHLVGRGIVLQFLARRKAVTSGSNHRRLTDAMAATAGGQGRVFSPRREGALPTATIQSKLNLTQSLLANAIGLEILIAAIVGKTNGKR